MKLWKASRSCICKDDVAIIVLVVVAAAKLHGSVTFLSLSKYGAIFLSLWQDWLLQAVDMQAIFLVAIGMLCNRPISFAIWLSQVAAMLSDSPIAFGMLSDLPIVFAGLAFAGCRPAQRSSYRYPNAQRSSYRFCRAGFRKMKTCSAIAIFFDMRSDLLMAF